METILGAFASMIFGALLGVIFFWGLWKTIERISSVGSPYLWMFSSFVIRTAIVLAGFYLMLLFHWHYAAAGLIGFVASRIMIMRFKVHKSQTVTK